jgi:rhodanese-related sulfurtransferase
MIRDRLKSVARKVAIRVLGMEFDTEARDPNARGVADPSAFDPDKIPTVVDGAGDTPGPNHKEDIGRTWASAQVAGGVPPFFIDIRPPPEIIIGMLPGAVLSSGMSLKERLEILPTDRSQRVTIYDQTGNLGSAELAQWLREQGWEMARRLQGGFAEWMEFSEPIVSVPLEAGATHQVADPVKLTDGRTGFIHTVMPDGAGFRYLVWIQDHIEGPMGDDDLAG